MNKIVCSLPIAVAVLACSGHQKKLDPRYPPQPEGCKVMVFYGAVPNAVAFDHIGRVDMICGELIASSDCMRSLMDEACKFGGDLIYDITGPTKPTPDKVKYDARVGHTRVSAAPPATSR